MCDSLFFGVKAKNRVCFYPVFLPMSTTIEVVCFKYKPLKNNEF